MNSKKEEGKELTKEVIQVNGMNVQIKEAAVDNALAKWELTLSAQERDLPIAQLNEEHIFNYIKALFVFQNQVLDTLQDASAKALVMLVHRLYEKQIEDFNIDVSFMGTKDEVQFENFNFSIKKVDAINRSEARSEYADTEGKESHPKVNFFYNQRQEVLNLYYKLKEMFNDEKGTQAALSTSGLLLIFEYMSIRNIETNIAEMSGLVSGDKELGQAYLSVAVRKEVEYNITHREIQKIKN